MVAVWLDDTQLRLYAYLGIAVDLGHIMLGCALTVLTPD
jgi:hypothetical protein